MQAVQRAALVDARQVSATEFVQCGQYKVTANPSDWIVTYAPNNFRVFKDGEFRRLFQLRVPGESANVDQVELINELRKIVDRQRREIEELKAAIADDVKESDNEKATGDANAEAGSTGSAGVSGSGDGSKKGRSRGRRG